MSQTIATSALSCAADFLRLLTPDEGLWPPDPRLWMFRGQSNARAPLIASALRRHTDLAWQAGMHKPVVRPTHREQIIAEYKLLRRYVLRLDTRGLTVPNDVQLHAGDALAIEDVLAGKVSWPPMRLRAQLALAQHYGIPTRLLDWTRNPLFAGYFAARDAVTRLRNGAMPQRRLAVWAFNTQYLQARLAHGIASRIDLVTAPASSNPNLLAQAALFTLDAGTSQIDEAERIEALDRVLKREADELPQSFFHEHALSETLMVQLTLPCSEAPRLLRLLAYRGVDAAAAYPGHRGVAKAIREESFWDADHLAGDHFEASEQRLHLV